MNKLSELNGDSKVWLYHSDRVFNDQESDQIKSLISDFASSWVSHNRSLKSYGDLYYNRIIALFVDESAAGASGCSIDSSVHFLKQLGNHLNVDLFNRMIFSYKEGDTIKSVDANEFRTLYSNGTITDDTLVFDNLVKTKSEFEQAWLKPLSQSWLSRFV